MRIEERSPIPTFARITEKYLAAKKVDGLTANTLLKYKQALDYYFMESFGPRMMDEITYDDLNTELAIFSDCSAKTFNNALIPLRGVFAHWYATCAPDKPNPARLLSNRKQQKPKPYPFKAEEMEAIIAYMHQYYPAHIANMYEFSFLTGVRPGELIALHWSDLDERDMTIAVKRARVMGKDQNHTKTYNERLIDLTLRVMEVLMRQKAITGHMGGHIFLTHDNKPYKKTNRLREEYWAPALQALGIRYRAPYQTRHTYATTCLAAGVNQTYLARQMGHASLKMLLEVYADWVNTSDNKAQIAKRDQYLAEKANAQKGN